MTAADRNKNNNYSYKNGKKEDQSSNSPLLLKSKSL